MKYKRNEEFSPVTLEALSAAIELLIAADANIKLLLGAACDVPHMAAQANAAIEKLRPKRWENIAHDICSFLLEELEDDDPRTGDLQAVCAYIRANDLQKAIDYINNAKDGYS